ncbi:hypothetical protein CERZMDRAFT_90300 [Cercospora zeae-maydis SCOH1-5]|uniref:Uncharacterized protein n=1 Tax=Cercospora zeae-maydis SCOH1-5 TaxID=717836 RepID=A0A6A6FLC1_9PEZI|nr:hypothetical protein CERZMDRAFT_90300 [Cercospora zeae-maydis SCOH1-5]
MAISLVSSRPKTKDVTNQGYPCLSSSGWINLKPCIDDQQPPYYALPGVTFNGAPDLGHDPLCTSSQTAWKSHHAGRLRPAWGRASGRISTNAARHAMLNQIADVLKCFAFSPYLMRSMLPTTCYMNAHRAPTVKRHPSAAVSVQL